MAGLQDYLRWALGGVTQPDYPLSPQNFWPKAASAAGSIKPLQPSPEGNTGPMDYLRWAGGGMAQPDYPLSPQNFWPATGRAAMRGLGIGGQASPATPVPSSFPQYPQYLPPESAGSFGTGEGFFSGVPAIAPRPISEIAPPAPQAAGLIPQPPPASVQTGPTSWYKPNLMARLAEMGVPESPPDNPEDLRNPYDQNYMSYNNPIMAARRGEADARRRDNMRPATGDPYLLYLKRTGQTPGQALQLAASSQYGMPGRPDYGVPPPDVTSLFDPNAALSQTMAGVLPMQTVLQGAASMYGPALQETARAHGAIGVAGQQGAAHIAAPPQYYPETSPIGSAVGSRFGTAPQPPVPALTPEHMQWAVEKGYVSREEYIAWLRSQMAGMRQGANIPQGFQSRPAGRSTAPRPAPQR